MLAIQDGERSQQLFASAFERRLDDAAVSEGDQGDARELRIQQREEAPHGGELRGRDRVGRVIAEQLGGGAAPVVLANLRGRAAEVAVVVHIDARGQARADGEIENDRQIVVVRSPGSDDTTDLDDRNR